MGKEDGSDDLINDDCDKHDDDNCDDDCGNNMSWNNSMISLDTFSVFNKFKVIFIIYSMFKEFYGKVQSGFWSL